MDFEREESGDSGSVEGQRQMDFERDESEDPGSEGQPQTDFERDESDDSGAVQGQRPMDFEPEEIDLEELAEKLDQTFGNRPPLGYLPGRTALRDAVVDQLRCSLLQAEEVVDTMVDRGFLCYQGPIVDGVDDLEPWRIVLDEAS